MSAQLDDLLALGQLLAPGSRTLVRRVTQAVREPKAFLAQHAKLADRWGIERPHARLGWIALVDALSAARACRRIDCKSDAGNVAGAIARLAGAPRDAAGWLPEAPAEASTWEHLERAGAHLGKRGRVLAALEMDADSYFLLLVPRPDLATLTRHAGPRLQRFGGRLAAATRTRIQEAGREQRRERSQDARDAARKAAGDRIRASATRVFVLPGTSQQRAIFTPPHAPHECEITCRPSVPFARERHRFWRDRSETRRSLSRQPDPTAAARFAAETVAGWRRQGFRPRARLTDSGGDPVQIPADGLFFREGPLAVRWAAQRGTSVWTASGNPDNGSFAGEALAEHYPTAAESDAAFQYELRLRREHPGKPLTRAAAARLLERPR